ncbi:MAG: flagellar protein FliL [Eubacteriales bacterium]|nr:flagellar protein FliL [Eubacteriales bacterium]MDN5363888.1 flagellar protein FliL [Eubacteriales bacterium]
MPEEKEEKVEKKVKNPLSLKVLVIFGLVVVLAAGGVTFAVVKFILPQSQPATQETKKEEVAGSYLDAGEFITNLADKDEVRFIKIKVVLELSETKIDDEKMKEKEGVIRDTILSIVRKKTSDEVHGSEGLSKLRGEIKEALNKKVFGGKLMNVYFTDFVVQ